MSLGSHACPFGPCLSFHSFRVEGCVDRQRDACMVVGYLSGSDGQEPLLEQCHQVVWIMRHPLHQWRLLYRVGGRQLI